MSQCERSKSLREISRFFRFQIIVFFVLLRCQAAGPDVEIGSFLVSAVFERFFFSEFLNFSTSSNSTKDDAVFGLSFSWPLVAIIEKFPNYLVCCVTVIFTILFRRFSLLLLSFFIIIRYQLRLLTPI